MIALKSNIYRLILIWPQIFCAFLYKLNHKPGVNGSFTKKHCPAPHIYILILASLIISLVKGFFILFVLMMIMIIMVCVWNTDIHLRCKRVSENLRKTVKTMPVALGMGLHHLASESTEEITYK